MAEPCYALKRGVWWWPSFPSGSNTEENQMTNLGRPGTGKYLGFGWNLLWTSNHICDHKEQALVRVRRMLTALTELHLGQLWNPQQWFMEDNKIFKRGDLQHFKAAHLPAAQRGHRARRSRGVALVTSRVGTRCHRSRIWGWLASLCPAWLGAGGFHCTTAWQRHL